MKTVLLSVLWFWCGAAWLNPAMLTYVWNYTGRPYVLAMRHGAVVYEGCVDSYSVKPGWVFIDSTIHTGDIYAFRADTFGASYNNRLCEK